MAARTIELDPDRFDREELVPAAEALRAGQLVIFPTETVYGVGARADDPEAMRRLRAFKQRGADKPFARLAPDALAALEPLAHVPPRVLPAARELWPGPLTLVLPQPGGASEGVRVPQHRLAQTLLRLAEVPVAASSANRAGEPPPTTAEQARRAVDEHVAVFVAGGPARLAQASTVLEVADTRWRILRQGLLDAAILRPRLETLVLFVCTGNSCRSPMAEGLFRARLSELLGIAPADLARHGLLVQSAGVAAGHGASPSPQAVRVLAKRGIDIAGHRSQPVTEALVQRAQLIVAMGPGHVHSLLSWWPEIAPRLMLIRDEGVADPIGGSEAVYRESAAQIEAGFDRVLDRLFGDALGRLVLRKRRRGEKP